MTWEDEGKRIESRRLAQLGRLPVDDLRQVRYNADDIRAVARTMLVSVAEQLGAVRRMLTAVALIPNDSQAGRTVLSPDTGPDEDVSDVAESARLAILTSLVGYGDGRPADPDPGPGYAAGTCGDGPYG